MSSSTWASVSTPYLLPRPCGAADAWTEEADRRGASGINRLAFVGEIAAPSFVADALGIDEHDAVVERRRLVYLNEAPVEIATSYYPKTIAGGTALEQPRKIKGGAVTLLSELGYTASRVVEDVVARMPGAAEQAALEIGDSEPVISISRVCFDRAGVPFQVETMTAPARLRRLRYELRVG